MTVKLRALLTSPRFWFWYHGSWTAIWLILYPPALLLWSHSIPFLMFVSMQTALGGAAGGLAASLGARKADPEDEL